MIKIIPIDNFTKNHSSAVCLDIRNSTKLVRSYDTMDDSAQIASKKYTNEKFDTTKAKEVDFMNAAIREAISAGISNANIYKYSDEKSCGGTIFNRFLKGFI